MTVHEAEPPSLAVVNPLIPPREPVAKRYCPHGRQKNNCKQCGGSSICAHGREKYSCKQCGGGSICKHMSVAEVAEFVCTDLQAACRLQRAASSVWHLQL